MTKKTIYSILCILCASALLVSCGGRTLGDVSIGDYSLDLPDCGVSEEASAEPSVSPEEVSYPSDVSEGESDIEIKTVSGTENCWEISGNTVTFTEIAEDTVCSVSGSLAGNVVIDTGDGYEFELELCGVAITSRDAAPIVSVSDTDVTLTAKKGYENFIYDRRAASDDETYDGAIYAENDLTLGGKGSLAVVSDSFCGVKSKDDLKIKNLTLSVRSEGTALRGSDGVDAENCSLSLISVTGDGIKTSNSSVSSKGNQKGSVKTENCALTVYAACDGIDAAYDVTVCGDTHIEIFTDKYSPYSGNVEKSGESGEPVPVEPSPWGKGGPGGPGGHGGPGGKPGGPGGFEDGNTDKGEYSTKGIKAANSVFIESGDVKITSYDDAIHANGGETLENGEISVGSVEIKGGKLTLSSNDDGIHADGDVTADGGEICVTSCYEGIEGERITVNGGRVSVVSKDDGFNSTSKSGTGIAINGGYVYVYAGGDGLDSNSTSQYSGISFGGGDTVVISTSGGNSSIDTERGYSYTAGRVAAVGMSGGMAGESVNCKNFSSVGVRKNMSLSKGQYLVIKGENGGVIVKMPSSLSAQVVALGFANASITSSSSTDASLDENGVEFKH